MILKSKKEIQKALGPKGKKLAKEIFNKGWNNQFGVDFNTLVRDSVQIALSQSGNRDDEIAQKLNGNTSDSLAAWFDR